MIDESSVAKRTYASHSENGKPLSLAKAHICLELVAMLPTHPNVDIMIKMHVMPLVAALLFVTL